MEKRARFSPPAVGGSSLLVIFAVLTLSVFALLSLNTVQAERRLADVSVQAVTDHYEAELQAERIFARLRAGETVTGVQRSGDIYSFSCPVSDHQRLMVELLRTEGTWEVLRWQTVAEPEPAADDALTVWDGATP